MHFEEDFFKPEEQWGYKLCSMQKRFWASTIECLSEAIRICEENNIRYYAYYGTLLGAVRHKGFIPWDDDVDIAMMRKDYNKFIRCAKEQIREPFVLYNVDESSIFPLRIINTHYSQMKEDFLEQFHYCPYPTGIDIYVLDKIPPKKKEQEIVQSLYKIIKYLSMNTDFRFEKVFGVDSTLEEQEAAELLDSIESYTRVKLVRDNTLSDQLTTLAHRVAAMYNDTHSKYITRMDLWALKPWRENMPIEAFEPAVELDFCGMKIRAPKDWDTILKNTYGEDYMTPIMGGGAHEAWGYRKYEKELVDIFKKCGAEPPAFLFE